MRIILSIALVLASVCLLTGTASTEEMTFHTNFAIDKDQTHVCSFGLREGALPAFDDFDVPAPPASPDLTQDGFLVMVDPPAFVPNRWYKDFRPVSNLTLDRLEYFPMHLETSRLGEQAYISITPGTFLGLPFEMWIIGPGIHEQIDVPGTVTFTITSTQMAFTWELHLDDDIAVESDTWDGIKSLYR